MNDNKKDFSVDNILDEIIENASTKTKEEYKTEEIVIETLDQIINSNTSETDYSYNNISKCENINLTVKLNEVYDANFIQQQTEDCNDLEKEIKNNHEENQKIEKNYTNSETFQNYLKNKNKKVADFLLSVDNIPSTRNLGKIQTSKLQQMNTEMEIDIQNNVEIFENENQQVPINYIDNLENQQAENIIIKKENNIKNEEIDEYNSYDDTDSVNLELKSIKSSIMFRVMTLSIISILSLYILLGNATPLPLPSFLDKSKDPIMYSFLNLALLLSSIMFSFTTFMSGITNFIKFSSDRDTLPSLAAVACIIQNIALLIYPESLSNQSISLFSTIAIIGLLFNSIGKIFIIKRIKNNFKYVCNFDDKYSITTICDRNTVDDLTRGAVEEIPFVSTKQKANFLTNFLTHSFREDNYDRICKTLSIVSVGISISIFILSFWLTKNMMLSITAFTCVICLSSPLSGVFVVNLPLYQISKTLNESGCILGYEAGEDLADTNSILLDAFDLFPKKSINLVSIKTFGTETIDKVIVDAASVLYHSKSILTHMFLKVIDNKTDLLNPVENLVYEDKLGISAWIDNKRILIGTRMLMQNHNIKVPPKAFEEKYSDNNQDIVYLSTSGELTAIFIVELKPKKSISKQLIKLQDNDISLIIKSVDCMITKEKIIQLYELDENMIKIIPARLHSTFNMLTIPVSRASGLISCNKNLDSYIYTVIAGKKLNNIIKFAISIQFVSMILSVLIITVFTFIGTLQQVSSLFVLAYLITWFFIAVGLPKFFKL